MKNQIFIIIAAILLSACSLVNEPGKECPSEDVGEDITISFQLSSSSLGTRTDGSHAEEESEYRELEDGIDYSDLGLFVFVKMQSETESEEKLLLKSINLNKADESNVYVDGSPGLYNVSITILRTKLHELLFGEGSDKKINPDDNDLVQFRTLIVANSNSPGTNAMAKWNEITGTTFSEVINQLNQWHYAISYLYNANYSGDDVAGIYRNRKRYIPMFGTNAFYASQSALYYSRPEKQVHLGSIDMLRALAKVRVVDNLKNKDQNGYPKITGVEFMGSQNEARQLPANAFTYRNGFQVHTPNINEPDKALSIDGAFSQRLGVMPEGMTTVASTQRTGYVFVGYVPEQRIGDVVTDNTLSGMPQFKITIATTSTETKDYIIPFTQYGEQLFQFGEYILRNHIYTLSVNELIYDARITLDIEPWSPVEFSLDYSETVTVSPTLSWYTDTYASIDETNGIVEVKPWSTVAVPLVGSFGLQAPVGAVWTASLIPIEGDQGAFCFYQDGYESVSMSGIIDGSVIELPIVSTNNVPTEVNKAILQVYVRLGNGTIFEAPIVEKGKGFSNFTILQNPQ